MNLMISLKDVKSVLLVRAQRSLIEISCFCKFSAEKLNLLKHMLLNFVFQFICTLRRISVHFVFYVAPQKIVARG